VSNKLPLDGPFMNLDAAEVKLGYSLFNVRTDSQTLPTGFSKFFHHWKVKEISNKQHIISHHTLICDCVSVSCYT